MNLRRIAPIAPLAGALTLAGTAYAAYGAGAWARYGRPAAPRHAAERDTLLDSVMPEYEVVERESLAIRAPADVAWQALREQDLTGSPVVRALFALRARLLRGGASETALPRQLVPALAEIGWGLLGEVAGRELVFGAVTKPWQADPEFRGLGPNAFLAFREPGYVKIAFTLRVDPAGPSSVVRTETRAATTDPAARRRFRGYWAAFSLGIILIRKLLLRAVRRDAERRAGVRPC